MAPNLLALLAAGVVVAIVVVALTVRARRRATPSQVVPGGAPAETPRWRAADGWVAAAPSLEALGLSKLSAECHWWSARKLFVRVDVSDRTLTGRLERAFANGALEQFLGETATLAPGDAARTDFQRFVASAVGEPFATLPRGASLRVKAPEIPGDEHEILLTTPFTAPELAATVARVVLAVDGATEAPLPAGATRKLPPVAARWREATAMLETLGLTQLSAECHWRPTFDLFVNLDVRESTVTGRMERPFAGGAIERFFRESAVLEPRGAERSALARFVGDAARELLAQLPRGARLSVNAPEIPGDKAKLLLTTPFTSAEHAAVATRVLLAIEEAARASMPMGVHPNVSPIAARWQAAAPLLEALGLRRMTAECHHRGDLFVAVDVGQASVTGRLERACPGGLLDQFFGESATLHPGDTGRSELGSWVATTVAEAFAALPREARLDVTAPELAGGRYKTLLTTPFTTPEHAAMAARVLVALDAAAQSPR